MPKSYTKKDGTIVIYKESTRTINRTKKYKPHFGPKKNSPKHKKLIYYLKRADPEVLADFMAKVDEQFSELREKVEVGPKNTDE